MNDNPLISVIIPIYNVEQYLKRCVESLRHQTYSNLEIILVDDVIAVGKSVTITRKQIIESRLFIRKMVDFRTQEMLV